MIQSMSVFVVILGQFEPTAVAKGVKTANKNNAITKDISHNLKATAKVRKPGP